jgi:hypothetical protein
MRTFLAAALAAALALPLAAADPQKVAAVIESYEHPTLGAPATVSNLSITLSSNMTIRLASGSAAKVTAGGDDLGLFFVGDGSFEYVSADPLEAKNVQFEVKKASDLTLTSANNRQQLKGTFKQLYIRARGVSGLPDLSAGGGAAIAEAFASHREDFGRQRYAPITQLLAKQKLDSPSTPFAVAEFSGGGTPVMYVYDGIEERSESLYSLNKNRNISVRELSGYLWPTVLSDQPIGHSRKAFNDPLYLLTQLDYTLIAEANETAKLSVTETVVPRNADQRVFRFDMNSDDYDTNNKKRIYTVRTVTDAAGNELSFDHNRGSLIISLPKAVPANEPVQLKFEIEGNFLFHPNSDSFWQLGTEPWFPQPNLNGQYYKIHSLVKVRKPYTPFAPGDTVRRVEEGDYNVVENRVDVPVQFAVVHAGKYAYDEQKYDDGLTIRVATYALNNERAMKQLNNLAYKLIKFYEPWLGPFPFKEFNIIEINQFGYGQAPPATMFITKEAFNPMSGDLNKIFSQGINHRFAHEIAHQYWGHVVKMGSQEEQWITESFAEYSSALAIKQLKGNSAYNAMIATWRANANDSHEVSSIPLANRISIPGDGRMAFLHRTYLIYDKGAYLLAVLHKQLGDNKFLSFMRNLQKLYEWRYLTTDEMPKLLKRIDPANDYTSFFDQYYWGTEMPKM